jgi:hypothetical protein
VDRLKVVLSDLPTVFQRERDMDTFYLAPSQVVRHINVHPSRGNRVDIPRRLTIKLSISIQCNLPSSKTMFLALAT